MKIAGIQKTSTVDFPGLLSAVIFTAGCNYHCFYCHNKQLLQANAPLLNTADIHSFLQKRAGLLDGIVISGGEPTLQDDLHEFLQLARDLSYQIKLDTNGSRPEILRRLLLDGLIDYVAVDYKSPLPVYPKLCGEDGGYISQTVTLLLESGVSFELRTTLIPHITPEDLRTMAAALPALPKYVLQLYIPQPGHTKHLKTKVPYTPSQIGAMAENIRDVQPNVCTRI